jgi:hypothetical protein
MPENDRPAWAYLPENLPAARAAGYDDGPAAEIPACGNPEPHNGHGWADAPHGVCIGTPPPLTADQIARLRRLFRPHA